MYLGYETGINPTYQEEITGSIPAKLQTSNQFICLLIENQTITLMLLRVQL